MPTFAQAPENVLALIRQTLRAHHPHLARCEVDVHAVMAYANRDEAGVPTGPAVKAPGGYPAAAVIRIVPLKQRVPGLGDAEITIDGDGWPDLSDAEQAALIDHELTHLEIQWDTAPDESKGTRGTPKSDDHGRPKLKLRLHDWQLGGFADVVKRHGAVALEVQAARAVIDAHGQYLLWSEDDVAGKVGQAGRAA